MRSRLLSGVFLAALAALFVWAVLTGAFHDFLTDSARFFGIEPAVTSSEEDDDVLFDDDASGLSDVATDVFEVQTSLSSEGDAENLPDADGGTPKDEAKDYEFALTPDYLNALLGKYSGGFFSGLAAALSKGTVLLTGSVDAETLAKQFSVPAALTLFLPDSVPCALTCAPEVSDGRLKVTVKKVSAGSDLLTPLLSRPEVLERVESFLNDRLTEYLPSRYCMKSVRVTEEGMFVRFSAE